MIVGEHVTLESGTGCVHTAPGHVVDDYNVCQNYDIPTVCPVNSDGVLSAADLVLMQKWLLGVPDAKLADWEAGDLCADGRLDTFDLTAMRKEILKG